MDYTNQHNLNKWYARRAYNKAMENHAIKLLLHMKSHGVKSDSPEYTRVRASFYHHRRKAAIAYDKILELGGTPT